MNDPTDRKSIAREHCPDAHYAGTDATGAAHFWSINEQIAIVVGDETETYAIDETPLADLGDWQTHVEQKRGWDECRITSQPLLRAGGV